MRHQEHTDIVLKAMLNGAGNSPESLAEATQIDKDLVDEVLQDLKAERSFMFEHMKGSGDHKYFMLIKEDYKGRIENYLRAGGFTWEKLAEIRAEDQKRIDAEEERTLRKVSIAQAKKAMEDADRALEISQKALQSSQVSNAIANDSNVIAEKAARNSLWSGVGGAVIGSIVMWLLTKNCS